jgi:hypothetical protein
LYPSETLQCPSKFEDELISSGLLLAPIRRWQLYRSRRGLYRSDGNSWVVDPCYYTHEDAYCSGWWNVKTLVRSW